MGNSFCDALNYANESNGSNDSAMRLRFFPTFSLLCVQYMYLFFCQFIIVLHFISFSWWFYSISLRRKMSNKHVSFSWLFNSPFETSKCKIFNKIQTISATFGMIMSNFVVKMETRLGEFHVDACIFDVHPLVDKYFGDIQSVVDSAGDLTDAFEMITARSTNTYYLYHSICWKHNFHCNMTFFGGDKNSGILIRSWSLSMLECLATTNVRLSLYCYQILRVFNFCCYWIMLVLGRELEQSIF